MIVVTTLLMTEAIPLLTASGGPLFTAKCGLFAANIVPTYSTLYADLTGSGPLPTYTGYAQAAITWASVFQDSDGSVQLVSNLIEFPAPADNTGQQIYGYFVSDGGTPQHLLWAEVFPANTFIRVAPSALAFLVNLQLSPRNANGSASIVSN